MPSKMSHLNWCRLCINSCTDFIEIYDENEQIKMDVYDVTIQYFHAMFLQPINESPLKVMCADCWRHITEFDSFQKSILLAQSTLLKPNAEKETEDDDEQEEDEPLQAKAELEIIAQPVKNEASEVETLHSDKENNDENIEDSDGGGGGVANNQINENTFKLYVKSIVDMIKAQNGDFNMGVQKPFTNDTSLDESVPKIANVSGGAPIDLTEDEINQDEYEGEMDYTGDEELKFNAADLLSVQLSTDGDNFLGENSMLEHMHSFFSRQKQPESFRNRTPSEILDQYITQWRATLNCPLCNAVCANVAHLREHFKEHHPQHKTYIECCQRKLFTRSSIAEHARVHLDPNTFKCEICGRVCNSSKALLKHKLSKHSEANDSYADDAVGAHGESGNTEPAANKSKISKKSAKELDDIIARWKPNLECVVCCSQFPSYTMLQQHFHFEHPQAPFYIECCQLKLEQRWHAADHMQLHLDPNAFKCQLCNRAYSSSRHLYRHMYYTHSMRAGGNNVKSPTCHKCPICEKSFKARRCMQEHMATHTGQELYRCLYCSETFRYCSSLYAHLKSIHPLEWNDRKDTRMLYKQMTIGDS
ncbi:zinc finger protein 652-B [Musca domestica]|uniref:Zinc finger protein 652-B n=1 Tax=Musca domestica TaxID=7370 RepID=A0A1I8NI55_MUSDO|nr:zinc finger protein 652-B [Musca domestica]